MSNAKKCDRCGAFYTLDISNEADDIAGMAFLDKYYKAKKQIDLCRTCRVELIKFIKGEEQQ